MDIGVWAKGRHRVLHPARDPEALAGLVREAGRGALVGTLAQAA